MTLTFHIVVTPGSVGLARCSVASMLHWTPWHFNLVANGLGRSEWAELVRLAQSHPRLSCTAVPERMLLPHGIVLTRLLDDCRDPFFCFADVDFFITGPVADLVHTAIESAEVVTAGYHLALDADAGWDGYEGKRLLGPHGEVLGVTFFAVYRTEVVRRTMRLWQVGFERYDAPEFLPDEVRQRLWRAGYSGWAYDTGKVLNLLMLLGGARITHLDRPEMQHVGGLAGMLLPVTSRRMRLWLKLKRHWQNTALTDRSLRPPLPMRAVWRLLGSARYRDRLGTYRREQVARFFARYFRSLVTDADPPALLVREQPLRERIERMCATLTEAVQLAESLERREADPPARAA